MTALRPYDAPTGGVPVTVELTVDELDDGRRSVQNASLVALVIVRASGDRVPFLPGACTVLEPTDTVESGTSVTRTAEPDELRAVLRESSRRRSDERRSATEDPEDHERDTDPADWELEARLHCLYSRQLPHGILLSLVPYGTGPRLCLSGPGPIERLLYYSEYSFTDTRAAWRAALGWNGEGDPEGWYRHHQTGRRRPDGTRESEIFQP